MSRPEGIEESLDFDVENGIWDGRRDFGRFCLGIARCDASLFIYEGSADKAAMMEECETVMEVLRKSEMRRYDSAVTWNFATKSDQ
jgi:hypothetical protein